MPLLGGILLFINMLNLSLGNLKFEFIVEKPGMVTLSIIDIHGKVIAKVYEGMADASIKYTHEYDISELRSGIYFINLNTSNGNMKDKFVVIQ